jgi:hypothetical protein
LGWDHLKTRRVRNQRSRVLVEVCIESRIRVACFHNCQSPSHRCFSRPRTPS